MLHRPIHVRDSASRRLFRPDEPSLYLVSSRLAAFCVVASLFGASPRLPRCVPPACQRACSSLLVSRPSVSARVQTKRIHTP